MSKKKPSVPSNETDFELKMKKRDIRKMKRRVTRTFARFNNSLTTIIFAIIIALIIVSVINKQYTPPHGTDLQKFLTSLLIIVVFFNIFFSNVHNLTLLFQPDKFFEFGNLTTASFNIIFMLLILLMILIAFILTKVVPPLQTFPGSTLQVLSKHLIQITTDVFVGIFKPLKYIVTGVCKVNPPSY